MEAWDTRGYSGPVDEQLATAIPGDTSPDVWRKQMRSLRAMTPVQRLHIWEALNEQLAVLEEQAVRRRHPDWGDREVTYELIALRHGRGLADAARSVEAGHIS